MALLAIGQRIEPQMRWSGREPTIAEILSDSIVRALMKADGIDPVAVEAQLRSMAHDLSAGRCATRIE
jgi:hypothetical protein